MRKICGPKIRTGTISAVCTSSNLALAATVFLSTICTYTPAFGQELPSSQGTRPGSHVGAPVVPSASALNQILHSGIKTFVINGGNYQGDVQIPRGVTLVNIADKNSQSLNIQGSLVDSGRLVFRGAEVSQANLNAQNVFVRSGASIASLDNLTLSISALNNIVNAGTISSASGLNLFAGNSITNISGTGHTALIQAGNAINLFAGAGGIINTGLIQSHSGDISLNSASAAQYAVLSQALLSQVSSYTESSLLLNNNHGVIEALSGGISAQSVQNLSLIAGDYLSNSLNLKGVDVFANVSKVSGVVNAEACNAHLFADSPNLSVGTWNVSGDPIIANTGNVPLSDQMTNGAPLVVVAGKDITWTNGITNKIDTRGTNGGNVYLVAGAKFTPSPYLSSTVPITITGASSTGGKIDFTGSSFQGIVTDPLTSPGSAGNVEMSAFSGSAAGSGTIKFPLASSISTLGAGSGSSGHIFAVAGGSLNTSANPSIVLPDLNSAGGTGVGSSGLSGGHMIISTTQPNVSPTNPMVLDPVDGRVLQGGILGGALANSAIQIKSISTGGGQVYVLSGLSTQVSSNINTTGNSGRPGGAVNLLAGANGKDPANSDLNILGTITTDGASGFPSGKVNLVSSGNVNVGDIDTKSADAAAGSVFIGAGSANSSGTINFTNITTSASGSATQKSGSVVIISTSTCSTCPTPGVITGTSIDSSNTSLSAAAAPVSISATGNIQLQSVTAKGSASGTGGVGGSVFLSSAASILASSGIDTSASGAGNQAGGIYLIASGSVSSGTTQTQSGASSPNLVISPNFVSSSPSIQGNALNVQITFNGNTAPAAFNPGGYVAINDQLGAKKGGTVITLTVQNDNNVLVPIVSRSATPFTLIGSATAPSGISAKLSNSSSMVFFGAGGLNIGSANAFLTSPVTPFPIAVVSANRGNVQINNASLFGRSLNIANAVSNSGTIFLSSPGLTVGPVVSGATPSKGSSITLDALSAGTLLLTDSISSAAAVTLMPTGIGNMQEQTPSVIDASALFLGNANLNGQLGSTPNPIYADVNRLVVNTDVAVQGNGASVESVSDMTVSFSVGGVFQLTGGNSIILDNTKPNFAGGTASIAVGNISALKTTPAILSPAILLTSSNPHGIGTSAIPVNIGNVAGNTNPILLQTDSASAPLFISSSANNGVEITSTPINAGSFSLASGGNIIFDPGAAIISLSSITLNSKAGISVAANTASLKAATALNLVAGTAGIGFGSFGGGTVVVESTSLNIQSVGPVVLAQSGAVTFSGVSNVGKSTSDSFSLLSLGNNVTFATGASINTPSFLAISSTGGAITQASATAISINSSQLRLDGLVVGGANPLGIKGGSLRLNTSSAVNLLSSTGVVFADMAVTGSFNLEVKSGNINADVSVVPYAILSNDVSLKIDSTGDIGSASRPLVLDTGSNNIALSLQAEASKGSVYISGAADLTKGAVGLTVKNSSAGSMFSISTLAPVTFDSTSKFAITAGKSVTVFSNSKLTQSGTAAAISSPVVSLSNTGTTNTILLSNLVGKTAAVDLTFATKLAPASYQGASLRLVGSSVLSNSAAVTASTTSGDISIAAGATVKLTDGSPATLSLLSSGNIFQAAKGTTLSVPNLNLSALGSNTSIGTAAVNIGTSSGRPASILLNPDATGNVFITNNGQVSLVTTTTTVKTFQLSTTGPDALGAILVSNSFTASDINLHAGGAAGIAISSPITATNNMTLSTAGVGSILGFATISASNLGLSTGSGAIGGSTPMLTAVTSSITANVSSGVAGGVNISNTGANVILKNSSSGGSFTFTNNGTLTVNSVTSRAAFTSLQGTIIVSTTGGASNLNIAPSAKISTSSGSILFQNANATGLIDVGKGAKISTMSPIAGSSGSVGFLVGATFGSLVSGQVLPAGLSLGKVTGGGVYSLGQTSGSSVKVSSPGNVLNLIGQAVLFDTGAGSPQLITLGGGVVITADPVDPSAAQAASLTGAALKATALAPPASSSALINSEFRPASGDAIGSHLVSNLNSFVLNQSAASSSLNTLSGAAINSKLRESNGQSGGPVFFQSAGGPHSAKADDSNLRPIAFTSCNLKLSEVQRAEVAASVIFSTPDLCVEDASNELHVSHGTLILVPKTDTKLVLGGLVCTVKRGVVLYARVGKESTEIVNLADKQRGQVEVLTPNGAVQVEMGKTLVLSNSAERLQSEFPVRNEVRHSSLLTADISLPYLLTTELAKGLKSSDLGSDRSAYLHVLKSCAAYVSMNKKQGYAFSSRK